MKGFYFCKITDCLCQSQAVWLSALQKTQTNEPKVLKQLL